MNAVTKDLLSLAMTLTAQLPVALIIKAKRCCAVCDCWRTGTESCRPTWPSGPAMLAPAGWLGGPGPAGIDCCGCHSDCIVQPLTGCTHSPGRAGC